MNKISRRLPWFLTIAFMIVSPNVLAAHTPIRAHICSARPTLPADVQDQNASFDTLEDVIAAFNFARKQENCDLPLRINPAVFRAASPDQIVLLLINAERRDRGLRELKLDTKLLSQIALNHAKELVYYGYYDWNAYSSPINAPNKFLQDRYLANPLIRKIPHFVSAENIARVTALSGSGAGVAARSVYSFLYRDSRGAKPWGSRQSILGYLSPTGDPGHYNWVGIGEWGLLISTGFFVVDFLEGRYMPPRVAHTLGLGPRFSGPAILDANTVQVTGVHANSYRSADGAASVTGVVFYIDSIGYQNGAFTTVSGTSMGNGTWRATLPVKDPTKLHAVAVDGRGNYTDCGDHYCGENPVSPPEESKPVLTPRLIGPRSISLGPDGNLWFTEYSANKIGRITPGGLITEFAIPTANGHPSSISRGPDGSVWFTQRYGANKIGRITTSGVITFFDIPTSDSDLSGISGGPDGNLWFTDAANRIGRITPSGAITEFKVPNAAGLVFAISNGPDGNLWFTEASAGKIGRITPRGVITEFEVPANDYEPSAISSGPDGNVWFVVSNKIVRITPKGVITEFEVPIAGGLYSGICGGPDGNLWFTMPAANKIGRITPSGVVSQFDIPTSGSDPSGINSGPDGNLWFAEAGTNKIGRITPDGDITEFALPTGDGLPSGNSGKPDISKMGQIAPN